MAYSEPVKNEARRLAIDNAVRILTVDRPRATLTRRSYVREVRDHIQENGTPSDKAMAASLSDETIARWEGFFDSIVQTRKPSELKVAYLSGPNPENDLAVLCKAGVLPENIWAFESDSKTYSEAVQSALDSEFPFIKIVQGGIDSFLLVSPQKFDIIYLDFCGPLPSRDKKQRTLLAVTRLLASHALNSPAVLVTNTSLPTKAQDESGRSLLARLVAAYLYPKEFLEREQNAGGAVEGAIANGLGFDDWLAQVETHLDDYYGQYVTRLLMDHMSVIAPATRLTPGKGVSTRFLNAANEAALRSSIQRLFHFNQAVLDRDDEEHAAEINDDGEDEEELGGDVITESGDYPLLWTLAALDADLGGGDVNYPNLTSDPDFKKYAEMWISQLSDAGDKNALIYSLCTALFLVSEGTGSDQFYSSSLARISKTHRFDQFYLFCDLFLFHQLKELLVRQWTVPYHVNVKETMRWKYQAKDTPMFMDLLIVDECRYVYDWMPTIDMISSGVSDIERQLSFRFALDGVSKHTRWYNSEYFRGTAVIDQYTEPFEAQELRQRHSI